MGAYHLPRSAVQIHATSFPGVVFRHRTSYFKHLTVKRTTFFIKVTQITA